MSSAEIPFRKHYRKVNGKRLAYVDEGIGDPIVLLHGNPTSSFLWRNVIPELKGIGRIIVPDLIGHGDSDKLPVSHGSERYTFQTAYEYLDGLLTALNVIENVILIGHDWGSALGFHWAKNHATAVNGIGYMEALVMPLTWSDWPEAARGIFQRFRSDKGEELVLNRNMFVDAVLPNSVLRDLTDTEMNNYRAPFQAPDDRQPTLNWPRQIPIEGEPANMVKLVSEYGRWLETSISLPKLFINAAPGSILVGRQREYCRSWPEQIEVTVPGKHFIQEDSPVEIGQAILAWIKSR